MKLKQKLVAAIVAAMATTSVVANPVATLPTVGAFSKSDMASLFDQDAQPLQLAALSGQEMKETEGAWWHYVAAGVGGGFYNGISYYYKTPNRTWGGWSTAIGSGFAGGAIGSIRWWTAPIWGGGIIAGGNYASSYTRTPALTHSPAYRPASPPSYNPAYRPVYPPSFPRNY